VQGRVLQQNSETLGNTGETVADQRPGIRLIAQLGSAVAVALSLVFVAIEVRETSEQTALNTAALQVAAYQDLIGQINEWNRTMLDPNVAALHVRLQDPQGSWTQLTDVEEAQAIALVFLLTRHADMAFYQFERGVISEERLTSVMTPFIANLQHPMIRAHWERTKRNFVPAFAAYVDQRVATLGG
jgi:hypothetical protein